MKGKWFLNWVNFYEFFWGNRISRNIVVLLVVIVLLGFGLIYFAIAARPYVNKSMTIPTPGQVSSAWIDKSNPQATTLVNPVGGADKAIWETSQTIRLEENTTISPSNLPTITLLYPDRISGDSETKLKIKVEVPESKPTPQTIFITLYSKDDFIEIDNSSVFTAQVTFFASTPTPSPTKTPTPSPTATIPTPTETAPSPTETTPSPTLTPTATPTAICGAAATTPLPTVPTSPCTARMIPSPTETLALSPAATPVQLLSAIIAQESTPTPALSPTPTTISTSSTTTSTTTEPFSIPPLKSWTDISLEYGRPCYFLFVRPCPPSTTITIEVQRLYESETKPKTIIGPHPITIEVSTFADDLYSVTGVILGVLVGILKWRKPAWELLRNMLT